jgi:hypothetical protein
LSAFGAVPKFFLLRVVHNFNAFDKIRLLRYQ